MKSPILTFMVASSLTLMAITSIYAASVGSGGMTGGKSNPSQSYGGRDEGSRASAADSMGAGGFSSGPNFGGSSPSNSGGNYGEGYGGRDEGDRGRSASSLGGGGFNGDRGYGNDYGGRDEGSRASAADGFGAGGFSNGNSGANNGNSGANNGNSGASNGSHNDGNHGGGINTSHASGNSHSQSSASYGGASSSSAASQGDNMSSRASTQTIVNMKALQQITGMGFVNEIHQNGVAVTADSQQAVREATAAFIDELYAKTPITPTAADKAFWTGKLLNNEMTMAQAKAAFNAAALETIYQNELGRSIDETGKAHWMKEIESGKTINEINADLKWCVQTSGPGKC